MPTNEHEHEEQGPHVVTGAPTPDADAADETASGTVREVAEQQAKKWAELLERLA
ncbi:hypothetical protein ACN20G_33435 (plasmid) [Streptomyces sp. BI20]|uniref:hypothetical protein n=1 Tax=Streptomyces sp. BI20 TaxID=3403460 RepID=UPI003C70E234